MILAQASPVTAPPSKIATCDKPGRHVLSNIVPLPAAPGHVRPWTAVQHALLFSIVAASMARRAGHAGSPCTAVCKSERLILSCSLGPDTGRAVQRSPPQGRTLDNRRRLLFKLLFIQSYFSPTCHPPRCGQQQAATALPPVKNLSVPQQLRRANRKTASSHDLAYLCVIVTSSQT